MLQISHLTFSYQNQTIFQNLNLNFSSPEVVAIIGDNGAGKTTLLRLIAGELHPDDGAITALGNIGFLHQSPDTETHQSGGERTCSELMALFRASPQVLLLDEPTNNLDTASKAWLAEQLQRYRGLVLVVSHDRDFIDAVAHKVVALHGHTAQIFPGNYSDFSARRAQLEHDARLAYDKVQHQKKQLTQQLKVMNDRAHKSNRRSYNKITNESKLSYNGKRMAAQNSAGKILRATKTKLDQLSDITRPIERKTYISHLNHAISHRKTLLEITDLSKTFANKTLFHNFNLTIQTGERVRILGPNGAGKSTLFRIIMGEILPDSGTVFLAPNVKIGYISQDHFSLSPDQSFLAQRSQLDQTEIYHAAVTMDFSPRDINRPVRELSRGQLTKLAILELILNPLNLVIIDEITNHLDIRARENIERALQKYHGAILAATHDATFAERIAFRPCPLCP